MKGKIRRCNRKETEQSPNRIEVFNDIYENNNHQIDINLQQFNSNESPEVNNLNAILERKVLNIHKHILHESYSNIRHLRRLLRLPSPINDDPNIQYDLRAGKFPQSCKSKQPKIKRELSKILPSPKSSTPLCDIRMKQTEAIYLNIYTEAIWNLTHNRQRHSPSIKPAWQIPNSSLDKERDEIYTDRISQWLAESFPDIKMRKRHDETKLSRPSTAPTQRNVSIVENSLISTDFPSLHHKSTSRPSTAKSTMLSKDNSIIPPPNDDELPYEINESIESGKLKWIELIQELHHVGAYINIRDLIEISSLRQPHHIMETIIGYIGLLWSDKSDWRSCKRLLFNDPNKLKHFFESADPLFYNHNQLIMIHKYIQNNLLPYLNLKRSLNSYSCAVNVILRWVLSFHSLVMVYIASYTTIESFSSRELSSMKSLCMKLFDLPRITNMFDDDIHEEEKCYHINPLTADRSLLRRLVVIQSQKKDQSINEQSDAFKSDSRRQTIQANTNQIITMATTESNNHQRPRKVSKSNDNHLTESIENSLNPLLINHHRQYYWFYVYLSKQMPELNVSLLLSHYILPLTSTTINKHNYKKGIKLFNQLNINQTSKMDINHHETMDHDEMIQNIDDMNDLFNDQSASNSNNPSMKITTRKSRRNSHVSIKLIPSSINRGQIEYEVSSCHDEVMNDDKASTISDD